MIERKKLLKDGKISITIDEYEAVLEALGWTTYPRSLGDPRQRYGHDTWPVYRFLMEVNHKPNHGQKRTAFISHNRYSKNDHYKKVLPSQIEVGTLMFDFDSDDLNHSHSDVKKLSTYMKKQGIPHMVLFTGSKGFHLHAKLVPKKFRFKYHDGSADSLKTIIRQIQNFFKKKLRLETMDEAVIGEPKKLARMPYSWHVNRIGVNSKRICVPLTLKQLFSLSTEEISEYSMNPNVLIPENQAPKETLIQLAERMKLKEAIRNETLEWQEERNTIIDTSGELVGLLALFNKKCPGWYADLQHESKNPIHPTRVGFALFCKQLGYGPHDVDAFWKQLSLEQDYLDSENDEYRMEQILNLYQPRYKKPASCWTIKKQRRGEKSICVGPACPKYDEKYDND